MPKTLDEVINAPGESAFWSAHQRGAFLAAHHLIGNDAPGFRAAREWKHQRGAAFEAWRQLSKSQRRRQIRLAIDRVFGIAS